MKNENNISVDFYDYSIHGKMVVATVTQNFVPDVNNNSDYEDYMKQYLTRELVKHLIEYKLVEFTKAKDPITMVDVIRARCFVTPDSMVRIIRSTLKV